LVANNQVTINGEIATKNALVEEGDIVRVNDQIIVPNMEMEYIVLNKPRGIICTGLSSVAGNIIDFVNYSVRVFPVGRLDKESEGLILLTNDGPIAHKILHGEHGHEKEYIVTVDRTITKEFIHDMSSGVNIGSVTTKKCIVKYVNDTTFRIILTQGLNRQIRKMCKALGFHVMRLQRVRILNIEMGELEEGKWRHLSEKELTLLKNQLREEEKYNENFN
jgi:23S rRNA pseudouridine2604 synthase